MNVLLVGGAGSLMNQMIIKLKKEGHRVYLLTGTQYEKKQYEKVFECYHFGYSSDSLGEIFESVAPDVTVFLGAYDTNFNWNDSERESVRYVSSVMNLLVAYSRVRRGRFLYLSSEGVYHGNYREDITEEVPVCADGFKGIALVQAENLCKDFKNNLQLDVVVARIDHLYGVPKSKEQLDPLCGTMCVEALQKGYLTVDPEVTCSVLFESDAVEFIYQLLHAEKTGSFLYHLSSGQPVTEYEIAKMCRKALGKEIEIMKVNQSDRRQVLSNRRFVSEYGGTVYYSTQEGIQRVAEAILKRPKQFLANEEEELPFWEKMAHRFGWMIRACVPFIENMCCFIPFFMLNNRTVDSQYFSRLDFYLIYVLLFGIVYGQQQAVFSAMLSVCGYLFRQMYTRSGFEVMMDYTTYVWMAQLFVLGLVVGYMRDQIRSIRKESEEVQSYLRYQLGDIREINSSNVRVKDVLEKQVIDQKDSIGKLYSITSTLDQYMPEEVLFYAVEILSNIMRSPDVAIYSVYNSEYARMFSASSEYARKMGNSIRYAQMGEMYDTIKKRKVFINRQLDERYPLMANAIFENDEMKMILMVWGIPWERMTLGQANLLVVISYLIQNAMLRANRYLAALEEQRYLEDTHILEPEAFESLVSAFQEANKKNLTVCTLLQIQTSVKDYEQIGDILMKNLRQTDYLGTMKDGKLYVLLANTLREEADIVINRFAEVGFESKIIEKIEG